MSETPARLAVALADRYRIERELGAGGMATVYLAADLKHDRKVALKVLKPELAAVLGAERFVVEIKTTAALQHPHILPLFDSGVADGFLYYVMPYIEGETLRDKLNRESQLGVDEAVRLAREVADALDYAHRHGVIHRDIKPENILLHDGRPMVADFGIALALSAAAGGRMTETGMSLGTPHYMSPEQATAEKEITARSDVYSLGSVLYEMLAGQPPHLGGSAQQIIMKIITEDAPPVTSLRKSVPPNVAAAVAKAIEKLPADRFATAHEFAEALGNVSFASGSTVASAGAPSIPAGRRPPARRALAAAPWVIAVTAVAVAGWVAFRPRPATEAPVVLRYAMVLPDSQAFTDADGEPLAYSADGSAFAFVSRSGILLRQADRAEPVPVPGARRATGPFFSPDGKWLGFRDGARLLKVPLDGGSPVTICDSCVGYSSDWGTDDTIRYHTAPPGDPNGRVLMAVSARGGLPRLLARPDSASKELFRSPMLLPDRRTVLFAVYKGETAHLAALDLRSGRITRFDQTGISPHWVEQGYVVLGNPDGTLSALPFDARRVRPVGEPVTIARNLLQPDATAMRAGVSKSGAIVYVESGGATQRHLALVSRSGQATALPAEPKAYEGPRFSPDGRHIAVDIIEESGGGSDVWVLDVPQHAWSRLTTDRISNRPVWTADGRRVVYSSNADLWWVAGDGSTRPESLLVANGSRFASSVTPDGHTVIFQETGGSRNGIYSLAFDSAPAAVRTVIPAAFNESAPALSPDGGWLAYQSDEAGRMEVYVRPFPGAGARVPVSVLGGSEPAWSRDGKELFYRTGDSMMVASVALRPTFAVAGRHLLFRGTFLQGARLREFDVAPDGQHLVMVEGTGISSKLIAVHHLFDKLVNDRRRQ